MWVLCLFAVLWAKGHRVSEYTQHSSETRANISWLSCVRAFEHAREAYVDSLRWRAAEAANGKLVAGTNGPMAARRSEVGVMGGGRGELRARTSPVSGEVREEIRQRRKDGERLSEPENDRWVPKTITFHCQPGNTDQKQRKVK